MPIQLNYTNQDTGENVPAAYGFLMNSNFDTMKNVGQFDVGLFVNLAAKNAGKKPMLVKSIIAKFSDLGLTNNTTLAQTAAALYNFALTYADIDGIIFFNGGTIV